MAVRKSSNVLLGAIALLVGDLRSADTLQPKIVLTGSAADDKASITPDGRWMAMTDWGSGDAAFLDMSSGQIQRLGAKTGGWESDSFAEFVIPSPDMSQVAYVWHEGSNPGHLRVIPNQSGAKSRVLVQNAEFPYVLPSGWSADGKSILVHMWKKDYTAQIAWVSIADGSFRVLRSLDWRRPGAPSLSPDGRFIAYSALENQDSENSHIYLLAADGSSEKELVGGSGVNEAPVWTPDGSGILFLSDRSGTFDLWKVAVGGPQSNSAPSRLRAGVGKIHPIGMTRSGSLFYVSHRGTENVFLADLDAGTKKVGAPLVRLSDNFAGSNRGPAWSPDGKFIAFKRRTSGNRPGYGLVIRSIETGQERIYASGRLVGVPARPLWSRDGKSLLLAMADRQERISYQRLDRNSGDFAEVLAPDASYLSVSALSPDESTLYVTFQDEQKHTGGIAAYDLATGDYRTVFSVVGFVNNFALSRDGKTLAMALSLPHAGRWEGHLARVGIDGNGFRELYTPEAGAPEKDIFGGGPMLAWTKDDRSILFAQGTREWKLMRISSEGGPAEFVELTTTGLQHDLDLSPDGARIAFGHGKAEVKETQVLENLISATTTSVPALSPKSVQGPLGLDAFQAIPESNPLSAAKVALGRKLFFDKDLSRDRTLACSSCHDPERAFSDGRPVAKGFGDAEGVRNSPAIVNRGYGQSFFWDGRAGSLEQQALEPILNPKELALSQEELEQRTKLKAADVTSALASFVRTIRSGASRFDRFTAGHADALTPLEKTGLELFRGKGHCVTCHVGPNFTDEQFHNTGIAWNGHDLADRGKANGTFKTPTLRELPLTAPYMHDGSIATLEDVVNYYSEGVRTNPYLDREIRPRHFTEAEKRALLAFLRSLSGEILY